MNRLIIPVIGLFILLINACGNADSNGTVATDSTIDSTTISPPASPSKEPINLATATYSMTNANHQEDPKLGIPSFDIYLHISGAADSLLIARDYAASFFDRTSMDSYAKIVPADALFLINSYYAGGGYYYYGLNENNTLKIYRIYQEEGNPDNEGKNVGPPTPQLMKSARIFADHNEVAQLAIE